MAVDALLVLASARWFASGLLADVQCGARAVQVPAVLLRFDSRAVSARNAWRCSSEVSVRLISSWRLRRPHNPIYQLRLCLVQPSYLETSRDISLKTSANGHAADPRVGCVLAASDIIFSACLLFLRLADCCECWIGLSWSQLLWPISMAHFSCHHRTLIPSQARRNWLQGLSGCIPSSGPLLASPPCWRA